MVFDDLFVRSFPGEQGPNRPRQVLGAVYSRVAATPVASPRLVAWSAPAARLLGLTEPLPAEVLVGNRTLPGMQPYASCYGGHQFGNWAGQLGDGRALGLGELNGWEVQLKGAGMTPYSRHADGRAVLRSSIREFLCSEIMHALGVPTTRALSLATTGEPVLRDMFYDGNPAAEPGAVCCRLSPSFLRFGHFEIFAHRGEHDLLQQLYDFVKAHYYQGQDWFPELCRRTARLMVEWARVGFVHGVMNTDNMSILGLTIDYGPYGWLDSYDPGFTPNTTDRMGRYAYGQQGRIGLWNLERLATALTPIVPVADLEAGLEEYVRTYEEGSLQMWLTKLGLDTGDEALVREMLGLLSLVETDFTRFFRRQECFYAEPGEEVRARHAAFWARLSGDPERARRANPRIIPRNFLVQEVINQAEAGDFSGLGAMLDGFADPYGDGPDTYDRMRPEWARTAPGCSALSCSS